MGFLAAITLSNALLHSAKTATGAITFDLKSPALTLGNGLKLNCTTSVGADGALSFGDNSADIMLLDPLELVVDENNQFQYYVKIIYDFSSLSGNVTFAQNSHAYDSVFMSPMTSTGVKNEYYSISSTDGTLSSQARIVKGTTFNVFSFLSDFRYTANTNLQESSKIFKMYVIVDISANFNSTSRTQMTYKGLINTDISALTYTSLGVCSLASPTSAVPSSVEIPYKVRFNSDGRIIDTDMDGSATGTGWITITAIDAGAFKNKTNLVSISNNGSLQTIGDNAFAGCTNLSTVNFDFTKIQSVGANTITQSNAFSDTAFYASITPDTNGLKKAGDIVLGCSTTSQSTTVTGCRLVAPYAFKGQTSLTSVTIASDVQKVTSNAFMSSSSVRMVDITACTSTSFENNAFANSNSIPITLKYASGSTLVNTLNDVTIFNANIAIKYTDGVGGIIDYSLKVLSQDGNSFYNLDAVNQSVKSGFGNYTADELKFIHETSEQFAFVSSFTPQISIKFEFYYEGTTAPKYWGSSTWTETIDCYYADGNANVEIFKTNGGTRSHLGTVNMEYAEKSLGKGKINTIDVQMACSYLPCFSGETKIQLADGTYKLAKDVEYDDLLLAWNMDEGCYSASYPVWISKVERHEACYTIDFEDGSSLKIIDSHRAFSADENYFANLYDINKSQIGKEFIKVATDSNGNALRNEFVEMYHTKSKVTNITITEEDVLVVNIVTAYQLNNYAEGVLCSTGFSNMYSCAELGEDLKPKYDSEQVHERQTGTNTMYTIDEFDNTVITQNIFQGWRIAELKGVRTIDAITTYIVRDYLIGCAYPTDANGNYKYKLSTSDGYSAWITEGNTYTLPEATAVSGKTFAGWYNNADGKYYQAGDTITIYVGTHFTACWE